MSPEEAAGGEESLWQLRRSRRELTAALQRLIDFQKECQTLKGASAVDEALDQMERLLERVAQFHYARLFLRQENGTLVKVRELCPDGVELDWQLVEWVAKSQETAVIPLEEHDGGELLQSLLLLPLSGNSGTVGVLALWLAQNPSAFTREQYALLSILSRETAAALDAIDYRARIEKGRSMMLDIIESVPHGLLALDSGGRVSMINGTMEITLGIQRDKAVGSPYPVILPPVVVKALETMLAGRGGEERELTLTVSGAERHLGLSLTPIHESSRVRDAVGHLLLCRDLELSHEIKKLRELDAMKNSFLALVSHELRTPMTTIIGIVDSLLLDEESVTPEMRREYLEMVQNESMRLGQIINDVLDLTQMESGQLEFHFDEMDPNEVVAAAVAGMEPKCGAKRQTVAMELCGRPCQARMDPTRMTQVLNNLLSNANKYTPEGGKITVRTRELPPKSGRGAPWIEISVEDNGQGIGAEHMKKIFDKFTLGDNIQHHSRGTGLGLVICKQIVEVGHHGEIEIESEQGKGTVVYVRLPLVG